MGEDWYNNATPEYKWLADVYGVKTKEELDKKVPSGLQDSLASLYNTSYSRFGNPDYDDYTLAAAYSNNDIKDEDLYNSIRNSGYEGLKFTDMTNDHWNKVLQNYMVGYNDFSSKHPHIPYSLRMENGYRASWDPSYEGYKGGQEQQAKAPATSQPVAPTQPASNPYADRDAAQQAAAQGDTGNARTTSPDVNSFAAGKAAQVPKPATPVVEPTRVAQEVPQTTAPNSQASQVQGEARQAVPHYQSRPTASAPDNMPKASRPSYEETDVRPVNAPRNIFRDYREAEKAQYQPNTRTSQPSTGTGKPSTHTAIANTRSRAIMPGSRDKYQPITSMEELARAMGYTSPEDERKMRRASLMNQRILAVGDALRHIGNIANTVGYAPAQQFNNPVLEEQARYEKGKAMRDRANQQFLTYQQQKAIQDAKARQLEAQSAYQQESLGIRKAEHQRLINAQKLAERKQDFYEKLKQEQYELDKAYKENKMTWEEYNAKSRRISSEAAWLRSEKYVPGGGGGVNGYTTTKNTVVHRDKYGKETGRTTTTTRTGSNGKSSTSTTTTNKTDNPYGGRRHGSGGGKDQKPAKKENKYGVKPAK